jgi:hypothetical protein
MRLRNEVKPTSQAKRKGAAELPAACGLRPAVIRNEARLCGLKFTPSRRPHTSAHRNAWRPRSHSRRAGTPGYVIITAPAWCYSVPGAHSNLAGCSSFPLAHSRLHTELYAGADVKQHPSVQARKGLHIGQVHAWRAPPHANVHRAPCVFTPPRTATPRMSFTR